MRILFITPSYLPAVGGAERQLALLGAALRTRGHTVEILTHRTRGLPLREQTPSGAVWRVLPVPNSPRLYGIMLVLGTLWWLVRHGRKYDAIQCMFFSVHAVACALAAPLFPWRWGARLACTGRFGELGAFPARGMRRRVLRWALNQADWLIALTAESAREMREFGLAPERIHVLPNAVDTDRFACLRRSYDRAARLLFVGRLTEQKNLPALFTALATTDLDNWTLTLAGVGPLRAELAQFATRLGIAERVQFRGPVSPEAMPQLYCNHDIFVLPSLAEGMSNALLEAMAAGMVCVCTPVGGAPDLIRDGENGIVADNVSAEAIACAVETVSRASPEQRAAWGRAATAVVGNLCSVEKLVSEFEALGARRARSGRPRSPQ